MNRIMKIGVTCAMGAPANSPFPIQTEDYCATADWLKQHDFDTMEIHIRDPRQVDGPKIADHCAKLGLGISTIGTGQAYTAEGLSITSPDKSVRRAAIRRLKGHMDLAKQLGCPVIIGSMRGEIGPDQTFAQVDERMVDAMKELADYAETVGTQIVIEAIDHFETDYLHTAEDVLGLISRVGSDRVLVHLDTYHMNLEERSWREPILRCGKKLGHIHVADNGRNYPGRGLLDFRPVLSALVEIGYQGSLTLECYPRPDGKTAALRGKEHLEAVMLAYGGR